MTTTQPDQRTCFQGRVDDRDWGALSLGERIQMIEVEGYLVLPDLLGRELVAELRSEVYKLETTAVDYSDRQRGHSKLEFKGGVFTELIAHSPTIAFLKEVFGSEVLMSHYGYSRSEPGHPGISLHTDGQPYGSKIFGFEGSVPALIRVLYYLDDLTPEVSPFRVIPRSHLSLHADGNSYKRFESHPEEVMVTCRAGSAVLINHKVFHGNFPNVGDRDRNMLAIAYRPAWAGPQGTVDNWDAEMVAKLPEQVKPFFGDRNTRHWMPEGGNKPPNMASEAPGINPSRWDRV